MKPKYLTLSVVIVIMAAGACGNGEAEQVSTVGAAVTSPINATTTSILDDFPADTHPDPPSLPSDPLEILANPNELSSPMGALCWIRWEIERHQLADVLDIDLDIEPGEERGPNGLADRIMNSRAWTILQEQTLPPEALPFAEALMDDIEQRRTVTAPARVAFEQYPEFEDYFTAAQAVPGCVKP